MIRQCLLTTPRPINAAFFDNVTIPMPVSANYRRIVEMTYGVKEEQLYRVCNGKNKKTCGYWENIQTKAKVESGKTTYNKNKKALIIKKILRTDFGIYYTQNSRYEKSTFDSRNSSDTPTPHEISGLLLPILNSDSKNVSFTQQCNVQQ
uniref:FLYWCH-type domain-containing protein n=2 Tax=Caenorhabditis tropicalis TaxID=1561998 RepID=A0A1I7UW75_9PELO